MNQEQKWELVQASLAERDFDYLVDLASRHLNCPIVILNNTSRILAHSHTLPAPDETWTNAVERGYITLEFAATLTRWPQLKDPNAPFERMTILPTNTQRRRRFYKLTDHNQLLGYLNVTETDNNFSTEDEADFYFVAQLLAKELSHHHLVLPAEQKTKREDLLLELVQGRFQNRGYFIDRASLIGMDIHQPFRAICADLTHFSSYNADEDSFKNQLLAFFPQAAIVVDNQVLTILLSENDFSRLSSQTLHRLDQYLRKKCLTCGISDWGDDLFLFDRYKTQALKACQYRRYLSTHPYSYVFYDEVKVYDILHQIPLSELIYYCNQNVYALYQYDQANGTDYLNTLSVYLQSNRSVKVTAGQLHLHRNTINYRVARARELFGLDFDDCNTANQLLLSCQMLQLIQQSQAEISGF